MSELKIKIDFSKIKRRNQLELLRAIGFDATEALDEKKNPDRLLIEEIDLFSLPERVLSKLCQSAFDEMLEDDQATFMRDNIDAADDDDIEQEYLNNHFSDDFADDDVDEVCTDPAELDDEQRCYLLADVLKEYARSSLRLTLEDAINTTKQMYQQMNWK